MITINFEQLNEISGVYILNNLKNKKSYVGSSKNLYDRLHQHFHNLKYKKHHSLHLQSSYNKYGEDAFNFSILELCKIEDLEIREQYWIDFLKPIYNKRLDSTRNTGLPCSKETKLKISNTLKEKYQKGIITTYKQDPLQIKTNLYDAETHQLIDSFNSIADALRYIGINKTRSMERLKDKIVYNKYIFIFQENLDIDQYINSLKVKKKYWRDKLKFLDQNKPI